MTRRGEDRWRAAGACIIVGGFVVAAALVAADKNARRGAWDAQNVRDVQATIVMNEDNAGDHPLNQHPR